MRKRGHLLMILLCVGTLTAKAWYPQGAERLCAWMIGNPNDYAAEAFAVQSNGLLQEHGFWQLVKAFCTELMDYGIS